jgi:dipeptidyl aminopeptidase/acylaminoacyl peptidase
MMPSERFERQLPELLTELAAPRTPDYFDDLFGLTARTRQRPAWTFLERWLPMVDIARQPILTSRVPLRTIGLGLLLIALILAAVAAFVVGTQRNLPAPFGPARNGLVAFAKDGDIYTADPVSGRAVAIVTGPETDLRPVWSLDGTQLAFERRVVDSAVSPGLFYVAEADGTGLVQVTPDALRSIESYAFSPDGQEIVFTARPTGFSTLFIAKSDGSSAPRTLSVGALSPSEPTYRPPDGGEIAFVGLQQGESAAGLYAIKPDGTGLRPIAQPENLIVAKPMWSPDGSRVAYSAYALDRESGRGFLRAYIVTADGQAPRMVRVLPDKDVQGAYGWSNDGTRLLLSECYAPVDGGTECVATLVVAAADGNDPVVEIDVEAGGLGGHAWAPDDTSILSIPLDLNDLLVSSPVLWDPLTGRSRPAPWAGRADFSWQRLAP